MAAHVCILLSVLLGLQACEAKLEVDTGPATIVANPGDTVQMKCVLKGKEPINVKDYMVQWFTRGKQVAEFDEKITIDKPGLSLSLEALQKGDATLTIASVTPEYAGNYRCYSYYATESVMKQIVLSVDDPSKEKDEVIELTHCDSILEKKLNKVIDWISNVDGKLEELSKRCPSQGDTHKKGATK